ncbi:hypothetical protein [Tissierella sp.]|uniref:hypothetical protein n=1 Tax=Tissierella sp. TaxID=41274 RepID=UPI0028AC3AA8|nr:hypothetical protein [Tissierella sp.]
MAQQDNMQVYQDIMNDIVSRTGGNYEDMSYLDKVMTITIMKEIKQQMDRFMCEKYPAVKAWASLDISDIALNETEPDLTRFKEDSFQEQFEKLMRGNL